MYLALLTDIFTWKWKVLTWDCLKASMPAASSVLYFVKVFFFSLFLPTLPLQRDICILLKHFSVRNSLNCEMCSWWEGPLPNSVKGENSWGIKDEMGFTYFSFPLLTKLHCTLIQSIGVNIPMRYIPLYPMHQLFWLLTMKSNEIIPIINSHFYSKNFTWILSGHRY